MTFILALFLSYLLGSIPFGYVICRFFKKINIRAYGSGNIGATNVARSAGKGAGLATLILDILKGLIAVTLIPLLIGNEESLLKILCALSVVAGHNWSIYLKFKGGKGVATTAGALLGLMPVVFVSSLCVWIVIYISFKYVSLASICAAISLPFFLFLYNAPFDYMIMGIIIALIGLIRHKENIKRLLNGTEHRVNLRNKTL